MVSALIEGAFFIAYAAALCHVSPFSMTGGSHMSASAHATNMRRVKRIEFALGGYVLLVAFQLLAVFWLSNRAIQNDVFMPNLFLGTLAALAGLVLLVVSILTGIGRSDMRDRSALIALLVAIMGATLFGVYYWIFGNRFYAFGETVSSLPPYYGLQEALVSLALGLAVGVISWFAPLR
jgi:hypothetical protein